jgi:hypothetical protein
VFDERTEREINKLARVPKWRQTDQVANNVFLLACGLLNCADEYLRGPALKIPGRLPASIIGIGADRLIGALSARSRSDRFSVGDVAGDGNLIVALHGNRELVRSRRSVARAQALKFDWRLIAQQMVGVYAAAKSDKGQKVKEPPYRAMGAVQSYGSLQSNSVTILSAAFETPS